MNWVEEWASRHRSNIQSTARQSDFITNEYSLPASKAASREANPDVLEDERWQAARGHVVTAHMWLLHPCWVWPLEDLVSVACMHLITMADCHTPLGMIYDSFCNATRLWTSAVSPNTRCCFPYWLISFVNIIRCTACIPVPRTTSASAMPYWTMDCTNTAGEVECLSHTSK